MSEVVREIFNAPINSPMLLAISVVYLIVESIRIYDARLIQANLGRMDSGVAARTGDSSLPSWVGYVHVVGWVLLISLLLLNWQYAMAFYLFLFLLRVLPVLENIGEVVMRPFLQSAQISAQNQLSQTEAELDEVRDKLSKSQEEIERAIFDLAPESRPEKFVPEFQTWWMRKENQLLNLEDALTTYIEDYGLYIRKYGDEPDDITMGRSMLNVMQSAALRFEDSDSPKLDRFKSGLRMQVELYDLKRQTL